MWVKQFIKTTELLLGLKILSVTIILYIKKYEPLFMLVALLCPTLCDPMDCSLQGSSIHGIFQTRILEWVAISYSRESSQTRDWTQVSQHCRQLLIIWSTREPDKLNVMIKLHMRVNLIVTPIFTIK